jgi:large subunit ribosomal protein L27e
MSVLTSGLLFRCSYNLEQLDLKTAVPTEAINSASGRRRARAGLKSILEQRYKTGKNRWFFQKLRF